MIFMDKKEKLQGRLGYNARNGRYGWLLVELGKKEGFHCGDKMEVLIDGKWVETRMEMSLDRKWYLKGTLYYDDLEYLKVRV